MEVLVKPFDICWGGQACRACRTSKIKKRKYIREGSSDFVYWLHVVTHLWKLQCYHDVLFEYVPACPKFSEITSRQYLRKGFSISLFFACSYLHRVRYPLKLRKYAILG